MANGIFDMIRKTKESRQGTLQVGLLATNLLMFLPVGTLILNDSIIWVLYGTAGRLSRIPLEIAG
jgi:hypothetical protein